MKSGALVSPPNLYPPCAWDTPPFLLIVSPTLPLQSVDAYLRSVNHVTTKRKEVDHISWVWGSVPRALRARGSPANREIKIHVYSIRQTANVSGEFLRIENKQLKKVQNDSCGQNYHKTTYFCVEAINGKRKMRGKLGHVVQIHVCRLA